MSFAVVAAVGIPLVIGGITAAINHHKAQEMQEDALAAQEEADRLANNRQDVYNAAEDIRALKEGLYNVYANVGVATQAAEMQQQQSDLALANMLEGQMAAGFGSAGATALAQAAARSKQGISANIEQQEAQNEKLRAQGEQHLQSQRMKIEQLAIGAEQQAWQLEENREIFDINRAQAEADYMRNQRQAYQDAATAAWMQGVSGSANAASAGLSSGAIGGGSTGN